MFRSRWALPGLYQGSTRWRRQTLTVVSTRMRRSSDRIQQRLGVVGPPRPSSLCLERRYEVMAKIVGNRRGRRTGRRIGFVVGALVGLTVALPSAVGATDSGWSIIASPNSGPSESNLLMGTACTSAWNCWAVGGVFSSLGNNSQPNALIDELERVDVVGRARCDSTRHAGLTSVECRLCDRRRIVGRSAPRSSTISRTRNPGRALERLRMVGRAHTGRWRLPLLRYLLQRLGLLGGGRRPRQPEESPQRHHLSLGRIAMVAVVASFVRSVV